MKLAGRRVAIGVVVVGAMVIVWAGIAFEEKLVEQWYLWKLDSAGEEEQELAAEELGPMRSRRAIPRLVEILRRAPKRWFAVHSWGGFSSGTRLTTDVRSHYSFRALVRIGRRGNCHRKPNKTRRVAGATGVIFSFILSHSRADVKEKRREAIPCRKLVGN